EPAAELIVPEDHLGAEPHHEQQRRIARPAEGLVLELDSVGAGARHGVSFVGPRRRSLSALAGAGRGEARRPGSESPPMPGRSPRHDRSPRPARAAPAQPLGPPLRGLVVRAGRDTPAGGALGPRARRLAALLLLAALAAGAPGCATLPGFAADAQQACWPRFPYRDGWLGGDGAWSVPLSRTRSLWLFGDTFV